ncbi:MAG: c-type cytochrome biogenesis protein CcmI [Devosia sp.]|nr:c-type cytochrome biogenesis protein CcmI [Devosia sp.]
MLVEESKRLGPMIFWFIAIAVTAIACAALLYAGRRRVVNGSTAETADANSHFRLVLAGIDADLAAGKIGAEEAVGAKGELAREMLRAKADTGPAASGEIGRGALVAGIGLVAVTALALYGLLGSPNMPTQPLAGRADVAAQNMSLEAAIARIEAQLATNPEDLRGWTVLAPALLEVGRYADAADAYGRVIDLSAPTAQLLADRAEALLLAAGDAGSEEAMGLLRAAAEMDPKHVQSRLYLAAELTRMGQYEEAARFWQAAIDLAKGDEVWLTAARQGLSVAQNDGVDTTVQEQAEMIRGMVDGLTSRLYADGGTIEEWAQLVRSYIVLGDLPNAQTAYDRAVVAYPLAFDRGELDSMALGAGLKLNGDQR